MKKSITHLPEAKQQELEQVKKIILDIAPNVQMIILFGSYARGGWVEDTYQEGHITYEYKSDYDLLVLFGTDDETKLSVKNKMEDTIRESNKVSTRASIIIHPVEFANKKIKKGNYFFTDIKKEGIMLYDSGKYELIPVGEINKEQRKKNAMDDFDYWFKSANEFLIDFECAYNRGSSNNAAFHLHQAAERYYHAVILVFKGYKPKTHDLEGLGQKAACYNPEFIKVFPRATEQEERCFELLKKAYTEARYRKDYCIQKEELEYLMTRVGLLKNLTEKVCKEKIGSF